MNTARFFVAAVASAALCLPVSIAQAALNYSVAGSTYTESFDSLPTDTVNNASVEGVYPNGWRDDSVTIAADQISLPGWFLYHPVLPASENGYNGHQRFRMGSGQNTGSFWGFGSSSTDTEKALGSIGSTTTAANGESLYLGLRLINNTSETLNTFTLTYDGEQWRDGQGTAGETLLFDYSVGATDADWFSSPTFSSVAGLNFTSPVVAGVVSSGTAVNGNAEGRVADITATVSGFEWAPGQELWLRWVDPQLASLADDGLAIDNVRFTASYVPEPTSLALALLGAAMLIVRRKQR